MIEERSQNVLPKIERRVRVKLQSTKRAAVADLLTVVPWAHHQENFVVVRVFGFDRFVNRNRTVNVFLIPETVHQHHRNLQRFFRQQLINCLLPPERIVTRMFKQLAPETRLL